MSLDKNLLLSQSYEILHDVKNKHFNLQNPVYLKISISKKFNSKFAAMYEDKGEFENEIIHEIKLSSELAKNFHYLAESIIHELVHAEQVEQGVSVDHNRAFFSRLDYVLLQVGLPVTELTYRQAIKRY